MIWQLKEHCCTHHRQYARHQDGLSIDPHRSPQKKPGPSEDAGALKNARCICFLNTQSNPLHELTLFTVALEEIISTEKLQGL